MDVLSLNLFLALGCMIGFCTGSRILVMNAYAPKSHGNTFNPVIDELLKRNHEITYVTMHEPYKDIPGLRLIRLKDAEKYFNIVSQAMFSCTSYALEGMLKLPEMYQNIAKSILTDATFQEFWKNPGNFDVIIANALLNEGYLGILGELNAPVVLLSPNSLEVNDAWDLNVPNPLSIIPTFISDLSCRMSFSERLKNCFYDLLWKFIRNCMVYWSDGEVRQHVPNAVSSRDVVKNASLIMLNSHFSYDCPRPYMPYVIDVGAMHCRPAKQLPEEFENFVQGSGDEGFIVFSFGSIVDPETLPKQFMNSFIEAFSQIKQRVVWKCGTSITNISSNVMLSKWIPQQDLMGHPKCKLAITHGGLLSMQETLYHGVPLLGVPLGADRDGNMKRAIKNGFAQIVNWETVTAEELVEKITEMILNKKYKQKAEHISTLLKDRPFPPAETAAYWVEYVIRHKGAKHLKNSGAETLNNFQYFLLDVILTVCIGICVAMGLFVVFIKFILKFIRGRKLLKMKTN